MTTDVYDQLRAAVQQVAQARAEYEFDRERLDDREAEFDATYADIMNNVVVSKARVADAELMLKALAGAHYDVTREKKPVPGVQIKERTQYAVTDPAAALAWARQSGLALIPEDVDTRALLKIASVTPLPFVTCTVTPQVQIDSVLPIEAGA